MTNKALITGASSGIGKALAFEYARAGFNLLLTGRDVDALSATADECREKYGVSAETFIGDLSNPNAVRELALAASEADIETLVNNAGSAVKGEFAETKLEDELAMLEVQLAAMLRLTKAVLPKMIERGSGRIVNVASVYSFSAVPKQAVYSACKSFILSFSAAIDNELAGKGIVVTAACPGTTRTAFRTRAGINEKPNAGMPAEDVARDIFNASRNGKRVVVPGFWNKVFASVSGHIPITAAAKLVAYINDRRGVNN